MQEAVVSLDTLGIEPVSPADDALAYAELYRVSRRLREAGKQVVGLLPATPEIPVALAAMQLGVTLGHACQEPVAVLDANTRRPAFAERLPGVVAATGFVTVWVQDRLALITPAGASARGVDFSMLEGILERERARFRHLLVVLAGFDALGEHLGAAALCDGVLLIARAGVTSEDELCARRDELGEKLLGVLLLH